MVSVERSDEERPKRVVSEDMERGGMRGCLLRLHCDSLTSESRAAAPAPG